MKKWKIKFNKEYGFYESYIVNDDGSIEYDIYEKEEFNECFNKYKELLEEQYKKETNNDIQNKKKL